MTEAEVADELFEAEVLRPLRQPGRALVADHWTRFHALLATADQLIRSRHYHDAAISLQIAANHAVLWHPGIFHSPELDLAIAKLGAAALPVAGGVNTGPSRRVVHVATRVSSIGGHSRMLSQWIDTDSSSCPSVVLTRQLDAVPDFLAEAVRKRGGAITSLNLGLGGLLSWAGRLQETFSQADLIVLHVHNMDILPFLALAGMRRRPPVILLNHGDHLFIAGSSFADLMASSRGSGWRLCRDRRGIEPKRNALLPLCLQPPARGQSKQDAKRQLGLAPDNVVILTVARGVKYRAVGNTTFADAFVPVLRENPKAHLVAVGPGGLVDWSAAESAVPGQITLLSERPDTRPFLDAADIYVDSFPFVSITSMFEAGLHGLPMLTRFPFSAGCDVLGSDSPGLDAVIHRSRKLHQFQHALRALLRDEDKRAADGAAAKAEITATNTGQAWRASLEQIYARAKELGGGAGPAPDAKDDGPHFEDLDLISPFVYGDTAKGPNAAARKAYAIEMDLKAGPAAWRWRMAMALLMRRQLQIHPGSKAWRNLLPEWLSMRLRSWLRQGA